MDHQTTRTIAEIILATANVAALIAALMVFWWAFRLLEELTRVAGRIAEDVQTIRSQTAPPYPQPQARPDRPY